MTIPRFALRGLSFEPFLAALSLAVLAFAACSRPASSARPGDPAEAAPSASTIALASASRASPLELPPLEPFRPDPLWDKAARDRDVLDLDRLAQREGAVGLLAGAHASSPYRETALEAFPLAPDGHVALTSLCLELSKLPAASREPWLRAIHGILRAPPKPTEPVDTAWLAVCEQQLAQLAPTEPSQADLVGSARQLLREHHVTP